MRIEPTIIDGNIEKRALKGKKVRYINSQNQIKFKDELDEYDLTSGEWEVAVWNENSRSWGHSEDYFQSTDDFVGALKRLEELDMVDSYDCLFVEQEVDWDELKREAENFEVRNRTNKY